MLVLACSAQATLQARKHNSQTKDSNLHQPSEVRSFTCSEARFLPLSGAVLWVRVQFGLDDFSGKTSWSIAGTVRIDGEEAQKSNNS